MYTTYFRNPPKKAQGTLILFPGRGQPALDIFLSYDQCSDLESFRIIAIDPVEEWYPQPYGANNQNKAVQGLKYSVGELNDYIKDLEKDLNINRSEIALIGFSAGAVMALQLAIKSQESFKAVVSHSGAILEPDKVGICKVNTKFLIFHNYNDDCFSWSERFIPMKKALVENNYDCLFDCCSQPGHNFSDCDAYIAGSALKDLFS